MTASPVVLVDVYACKHVLLLYHRIYGLTRHRRPKRKPKQQANYPFQRRPPWKPNRRASLGRTYVSMCIWILRLLMVLSAIQSPRRPTWTIRRVPNPKYFILPGVDWCVTTVNSALTRRRIPKSFLPFFWQMHKIDPKIKLSTVPGIVVSIDQLESPVPGFMPIAKGQPTVHKYCGALVFVDHASDFTYVHMHQHLATDETIDAKHAFERLAEQHRV